MIDIAIKSIFCILCLFALGIGPALIFFRNSMDNAIATAPTVGLILTTIIGSCLILFDLPILTWAYTWLIVGGIFSLCMAVYILKRYPPSFSNTNIGFLLLGLTLVTFLLLMPMLHGGLAFTVLRGNATDTFNYISLAGYLQHEPYSWGHTVDSATLLNKHPSYITATELLPTRWATSMLLGWLAIIINAPIQHFEYAFTVLFFILTYGCSYTLCQEAGFKKSYIILTSIAICTGFWAQFVMDIRAMSHITALPLLLLFVTCVEKIENTNATWKYQLLLGTVIASIAQLYIEILPSIVLGILLFFLMELVQKKQNLFHIFKNYILAFVVALVTLYFISNKYLLSFLIHQLSYASHIKNNWHEAYFSWLYNKPLLGFWGLPLYLKSSNFLITAFSICLSFFTGFFLLHSIFKRETPSLQRVIGAIILATVIEACYLKFNGQLWATGKAISYSYPYIIFFMTLAIYISLQRATKLHFIRSLGEYLIIVFLIIQCSFGLLRIAKSNNKNIYFAQTITPVPDYHHHDFDIKAITYELKSNQAKSIGLLVTNESMKKYLENMWGWTFKINDLMGAFIAQNTDSMPEYIITDSQKTLFTPYSVVEKNQELSLIKLNSNSRIEQIPISDFTYSDQWLKLNQNIALSTGLIKKIQGPTLTLKGKLLPEYFNAPIDLKLQINNSYELHKIIYPGDFEWNIPLEKLAKTNNKLDFLFTSNKIIAAKSEPRALAVKIDTITIKNVNNNY